MTTKTLITVAIGTAAVAFTVTWGQPQFDTAPRIVDTVAAGNSNEGLVVLSGTVRDFLESHADFEVQPVEGFGQYSGDVDLALDAVGKPFFVGAGGRVGEQWRDSACRPICFCLYDPLEGDTPGSFTAMGTGGITSQATFSQWYRDVPGINQAALMSITLIQQADGSYLFDDRLDPAYADLGGFFPIDGQLFGNSGGQPDHNYHFTIELQTEVAFDAGAPQYFRVSADDNVWLFVGGMLVIDLGGVRDQSNASTQYVDFSRLGLVDGERYPVQIFYAERHRPGSHLRIETGVVSFPDCNGKCPWDLDGNGNVGIFDFLVLIDSFGPCDDPDNCPGDFDDDDVIGVTDFLALIGNFGPCPGSTCVWDIDGNGIVDHADRLAVLDNFGSCDDPDNCPWDVNGDGVVNGLDLAAVVTHFGPCS